MSEGLFASWLGLPGIPREAEIIPLERDLRLVGLTRGRYHAAKISVAESADLIARAKAQGRDVTVGVSINHLSLNETDIGEYRTFFKLSPPLRAEDDRRAMIEALKTAPAGPAGPLLSGLVGPVREALGTDAADLVQKAAKSLR